MGNNPASNPVTPLRGYPLPVGQNYLADDVVRLATAITAIDTDVGATSSKLLGIKSTSTSYTILASDVTKLIDYTGASGSDVITLPLLASVSSGFNVLVRNSSTVTMSVAPSGGAAINGQSTFSLQASTTVRVVTDGTTWKVISIAQVAGGTLTSAGTLSAPGHSFTSDTTVGMYLPSTGQGGLVAASAAALFWSANGVLVGGASGGFKGSGALNAAKLFYNGEDMISRANGTAAAPTYSFASEASLGTFRAGAGQLGISVGGVTQFLYTANGLRANAATAVTGTQTAGSANFTDLYLNGVSLGSSLTFGANGLATPGVTGGVKGAGTINATDFYLKGSSLGSLLGLNGGAGATLNLTDLQIAGASLAGAMNWGANGVALTGATGGRKGSGTLNVGALYINGAQLNPGLITPTLGNALGYLRITAAGDAVEYRTASQVLNDLGVQTALGYVPVNRNGDTMLSLTIQGAFQVGAAASFESTLTTAGVASLYSLAVTTSASVIGSLVVAGVTTLAAASATSVTVNGSLGVSGASTLAAVTATTGRFTSNVTVLGTTTLGPMSASSATFNAGIIGNTTLAVTGQTTLGRLAASGQSSFAAGVSFSGGLTLAGGDLTMGFNQHLVTTDSVNGFQVVAGTLANTAGSTQVLSQVQYSTGGSAQTLRLWERRTATGSDWTTSATRLQMRTGTTDQGYLEWAQLPGGNGGLRIGAVDGSGVDRNIIQVDPVNGLTLAANVSVNNFLGVGGGAQLNGGVSLTGGVSVDTLTGSANWTTTGNISCRFITQTSDVRLKADFGGISEDKARSFVESADPVSYRWRFGEDGPGRHYGYKAQHLQQTGFAELVRQAPAHGMLDALSLDYASTIALLHVALRQSMRELGQLKARVAQLENAEEA